MKTILKYAVVLLLLFSMVGMASAAVDANSVSASATEDALGSGIYNVTVNWGGTLDDASTATIQIFDDTGSTSISPVKTPSDSGSYMFTGISLTAGDSYIVKLTDNGITEESAPFSAIPIPVPTPVPEPDVSDLKSTSNSNETHFELTWTSWTPAGTYFLEIYNGTGWEDVTSVTTAFVKGNPNANTDIRFRTSDGTDNNETILKTIAPVGFSNATTTDSITWTLSNWDTYGSDYAVTRNDSATVNPSDLSLSGTGVLTASNLDPGYKYTLKIRGNDTDYYSLYSTDEVELAALNLFDLTEMEDFLYPNGTEKSIADIENGSSIRLKAITTASCSFVWKLNNTDTSTSILTKNDVSGATEDAFEWRTNETGNYSLELTVNDGTNPAQIKTWAFEVIPKTTGDRVWDERIYALGGEYTWTARSFSGFYYDLDTGEGNEEMTIKNISRSIEKYDLIYKTKPSPVNYDFSKWGNYNIVGFMGDKYFAGDDESRLMKNGNLSKVLLDNNDKIQLRTGQNYALEEGYSISVQQIDINGGKAQIIFSKDGKEIGSYITNENEDAVYTKNVGSGSGNNTTFVKTRVKSVFQGTESAIVELEGFFQISDNLVRLESGTSIGKMKIKSVTDTEILMENDERISLSQDSEVELMGKVKLIVADSSFLKFMPVIEYTDPGVYEIRGTVSDYDTNFDFIIDVWNPRNFEGFYYDINDDNDSIEEIKILQTLSDSSRTIEKGNLTYTSQIRNISYDYSGWHENYTIVGFMGEKYYAGDNGSLLKDGNLSKVLIDRDDKYQMRVGSYMTLEEGVSIKVEQIDTNGGKARLVVERNGKELHSDIVSAGSDLIYEGNFSKINDTSFIRVRVDSVFQGTESSIVSISGVFQASLDLTKLDSDTKYGKMKGTYSKDGIRLSNDERITLSQDNDVEFMKVGNDTMYFKVGDSSTLRFAPVVERTIGSTDPLTVSLNQSNVTVGDSVLITVTDRGLELEGVTVYVNGSSVGTTNTSGEVSYTANSVGSLKVTGEKSGFVNGSTTLNVAEKLINMTVRVSPETVYYGVPATIKATDSLNGSAVSDATVYISGERVGTTNSSGEFGYTFNNTGNISIDVVKEKYNNGTTYVNISQEVAFVYSAFSMKPEDPAAKKAIKLSFDVTNNGVKSGSHDVSLILRDGSGNIVDQDNATVSVDMGKTKSVSLSVKAPEEGTYTLTLRETDSNRTIDLPSSMSTVPVNAAKFGSTILYVVLAILAIIVIAVIGFVAYLFGVKGATKDNYQDVAGEIFSDMKSKFQRK
ncbi:hypothetical protein MmiEs2_01870 [Methanimicrococcus stummii]|uniref:S-layer family duplication domain-containing protein n=1 Tax=Methanimicrococcus stummii TaxID=3028294 RepID=A0AA96VKG6_9EURY|nr:S-layer protein domain-containing protein [Methanimicrococcus sp. Es2]WNY28007.1 hypothetical protein MmiEs2_01870 [Methanimicrococcus sp. Es2]